MWTFECDLIRNLNLGAEKYGSLIGTTDFMVQIINLQLIENFALGCDLMNILFIVFCAITYTLN